MNCGSSSSRYWRRMAPTRVTRLWLSRSHTVSAPGSTGRMVRNFTRRKVRPRRPTRCCTKKTGPRDSSVMASAMSAIRGAPTISPIRATVMLVARLRASCSDDTRKPSLKMSALGESDSTASRCVNRS